MANAIFELAILLSLKDAASNRLDSFGEKLRARGKDARHALEEFESLRRGIGRDLAIGGIGIATLDMLKKGVDKAGDFQSAITELRLAIEEASKDGSVDLEKLNNQMARFSALGMRLGNELPGTTKDFVDMFVALKQAGIQTETILGGAGVSVAHLAVLTGSNPAELGKQYAQVGEQFGLKPEEYEPSAELFLKLYRAQGLRPEDLIEGTKFAQLRGGLPLGLKGLPGMRTMMNMLGLLKASGLEGGIGGRELAGLMTHLAATSKDQKKADEELRRRGINLEFFDKKGGFLGEENFIKQFEKLKTLNPVEQQDFVKKRFGSAEAMGPISIFQQQGSEGYRRLADRMNAVLPMQDQISEKMKTYNAQMEALSGTIDNLKVTVFNPMLGPLTSAADKTNTLVGNLQSFSEAHPALTATITDTIALGAAALTAYAGIKTLITGWRLWRIASTVGKNEAGIVDFLTKTLPQAAQTGATKVEAASKVGEELYYPEPIPGERRPRRRRMSIPEGEELYYPEPLPEEESALVSATNASKNLGNSLEETTVKASGLRTKLATPFRATAQFVETGYKKVSGAINALPTELKIGVTLILAQWTVENILRTFDLISEYQDARKTAGEANAGNLKTILKARAEFAQMGQQVPKEIWTMQAAGTLAKLNADNQLRDALGGWTAGSVLKEIFQHTLTGAEVNPYAAGRRFNATSPQTIRNFRERAPELREPEIMVEMRKLIDSWKLPADQRTKVDEALKAAFPESFTKASQMAAEQMSQVGSASSNLTTQIQQMKADIEKLNSQAGPLGDTLGATRSSASGLPGALEGAAGAAEGFAQRINNTKIEGLGPHGGEGANNSDPLKKTAYRGRGYGDTTPRRVAARSDLLHPSSPLAARLLAAGRAPQRVSNFNGDIIVNIPKSVDDPQAIAAHLRRQLEEREERAFA